MRTVVVRNDRYRRPMNSNTTTIRPFRIQIAQTDLDDLNDRLAPHPLARRPPDAGWTEAFPRAI